MIEAQIRYVPRHAPHARAARGRPRRGAPRAQAAYDGMVQRNMRRTVWVTGGCKSWYLDAEGRNVTLWPDFTWV